MSSTKVAAPLALGLALAAGSGCKRAPKPEPQASEAQAQSQVQAQTDPAEPDTPPEHPSFTEHVAPLIHARCSGCHRPGQVAPFSLLTEAEIRDHAEQIVEVTRSRYMPPWKPVRGYATFAGDRSLSDAQIELLRRWVADGLPTGPEQARPAPPRFPDGWRGGQPDLVIELPEPYTLAAEGRDVYRNFVLASPVTERVWVSAWELDPGPSPQVVHHAILSVDRGDWAVAEDAREPGPGFTAMDLRGGQSPGGFYLVWAPGTTPVTRDRAHAWPLDPGIQLILQVHLQPSGKAETVAPRIGLHLTKDPPSHRALTVRLGDVAIDIPAGEASYAIEDRLTLAADVSVLSVFPHAHYLGKTFESRAHLPDGTTEWLLKIDDWDFAWQDQYRYAEPVALPAGTVVDLRITWDNSAQNPRNPHSPPQRVQTGPNSADEMGNLTLELVPQNRAGMLALREAKYRRALTLESSATAHYNLANVLRDQGQLDAAITEYEAALALEPDHRWSLHNLSMLLQHAGRFDEAIAIARRELAITPNSAPAHNNLGNALKGAGLTDEAIATFREALRLDPEFALARNNLLILGASDR